MTDLEKQNDLEQIVDQLGMQETLRMLAQIAYEKAEHVQTTWRDDGLARLWIRNARKLERYAARVERAW